MNKILLVNDDGIGSPGLRALLPILQTDFDLTIVAPASQRSWIGKASSYHREIRCEMVEVDGVSAYSLDGTPSDCASAGIFHICENTPDLVISGINVGANVGDSYILSSGTIGGAIEAAIAGIPAIAVGVEFDAAETRRIEFDPRKDDVSLFSFAAALTGAFAKVLLSTSERNSAEKPAMNLSHQASYRTSVPSAAPGALYNLNMRADASPESDIVITSPAHYSYATFLRPSKTGFYHAGAPKNMEHADAGTDMFALAHGKISLSPLRLLDKADLRGTEENNLLEAVKNHL